MVSATARWTSSIAPVYDVREVPLEGKILTNITGQRSRAEMYAKEVLSEVE